MGPDGVINNLGLQYIGLRDAASNIGGTASIPSSMTVPDPLSTAGKSFEEHMELN